MAVSFFAYEGLLTISDLSFAVPATAITCVLETVSIARALALGPKLLLLDEPTEGLSPVIVPSIVEGLANIRSFGHAVFIAESNIYHVPDFTDRLYVIERGEVIFSGPPAEARRNSDVRRVIEGVAPPEAGVEPDGRV